MSIRTLAAAALLLSPQAFAAPTTVSHQGRLLDATGAPLSGLTSVNFNLYDGPVAGTSLWDETQTIDLDNGFYAVGLGSVSTLDDGVFDGGDLWLSLTVDGTLLPSRVPVRPSPYASRAGWAETADLATSVSGGTVDATSITVNGATIVGSDGTVPFSVVSGLPAGLADGDDDTLGALSCSDGQVPQASGGGWICGDGGSGGGDGLQTPQGGLSWIWANNPNSASYTPEVLYRYSTGSAPTITRSAVGRYEVSHPGVSTGTGGTHQVTAYGGGAATSCKISSWSNNSVGVECYSLATGAYADSMYTILTMY